MRLLVAENDAALGIFLQRGFDAEHYAVDLSRDGEEVKSLLQEREYDLAILDLNLPQPEGLEILQHARASRRQLPILVLTSHNRLEDRVHVLDMGADDFVLKPFAFSELAARVRALLRRGDHGCERLLRVDSLEINRVEHSVKRAGKTIDLTPKEFSLLEYLMRHAGRQVTRAEIIQNVWNLSFDTMTNVVDVYINYSSAQVDKRRVGQLAMAIQVAFQQMGIFDASNTKPAVSETEPMPFSNVQMVENTERFRSLDRIVNTPAGVLTETPDRPKLDAIQGQLEQALAAQIKNHTVSVTQTKEGIIVSLRELGFFDSGSTTLRPGAEPVLAQFVKVIAPYSVHIRIEGHTDNVPIHNGRFDSNWELSTGRASEIIKLFITKYGMAPDLLSASGYAQYHPVASNATPEGRALNRRVDLVILTPQIQALAGPLPTVIPKPDSNLTSPSAAAPH